MSQSKDTPFGCQANVANDSGGTALPSPRGRKHGVPPLVVLAKGGSVSEATVFELHPCRNRRVPLWMPSERRGGLGRNRSTVSSRPEARANPFGGASKRRLGLGSNRF